MSCRQFPATVEPALVWHALPRSAHLLASGIFSQNRLECAVSRKARPSADHSRKLRHDQRTCMAGAGSCAELKVAAQGASLRSRKPGPEADVRANARANPNEPGRVSCQANPATGCLIPWRSERNTMAIRTNQALARVQTNPAACLPKRPSRSRSDHGDPNEPALACAQTNRAACRIQTNPAMACSGTIVLRVSLAHPNEPDRAAWPLTALRRLTTLEAF
jgi:hypothetical protein